MGGIFSDIALEGADNFRFERALRVRGFACIAGADEAGRGPLAGPVVAASVVLPRDCEHSLFLDSKIISHKHRVRLFSLLKDIGARIGVGVVSAETIDSINILQASLLAMKHAIADLERGAGEADFILVDGTFQIPLSRPQLTLTKGESKSASIAAASIVAKVERDALMDDLDLDYPVYNFRRNKGYPTREHRQAIVRYGPCPAHRKTFRGVKDFD
ncbi:MAG: ribonuclease HII [Desulfocapsaceae bacterium]|nr:ribonuclease HII [Desulfocapsaceae bacterium]